MKPAQRELRNHLRARARQLGDRQDTSGRLAIDHLAGECAYEHWHRMLFARFLAENDLLIEPEENMAISLAEAEELAKEEGVDVWVFASRCAQRMLPQIFRPDDPLLQVSFATEHMLKLEKLLASLPAAVFTASDALGWVYQFWQSKKKDEVNRSEVKIGADEISAVTQLFTEPYMVEFLLHNTLGAWWAGKKLARQGRRRAPRPKTNCARKLALPGVGWEYLRFVRGADGKAGRGVRPRGRSTAGRRPPRSCKVLDPCCGSGHFLVAGSAPPRADPHGRGRLVRRRSRRCGAARQPARPGDRRAVLPDRRVRPGVRRLDLPGRRRLPAAAGTAHRLHRHRAAGDGGAVARSWPSSRASPCRRSGARRSRTAC